MGIELFVLDDGWFGKRNNTKSSKGDWVCNYEKLPHGIEGLSKRIHDMDMQFGIWVEPEVVSVDSDLFRAPPVGTALISASSAIYYVDCSTRFYDIEITEE